MEKNLKTLLLSCVFLSINSHAAGNGSPFFDVQVIEDRGGQSIKDYMPQGYDSIGHMKEVYEKRRSMKLVHAHFPVVTTKMKIGRVTEN